MYEIIYSQYTLKQLKKLDKTLRARIISALVRIRIRPYPFVKKLVNYPFFSFRVGDYRMILDIQENKLVILVVELGHRKKVYKGL